MKTPTNYGGWDLASWLLANNQFVMADLYTITLAGGFVARYTNSDGDLTVGGNLYASDGPIIGRSRIRTVIGVEVDTLDITLAAQPQHTLNGTSWFAAMRAGALDGARVQVDRFFTPSWGSSQYATVIGFAGRVSTIPEIGRTSSHITVKSDLELLNIKMPRNLYEPSCINTPFDASCALSKPAYTTASAVNSGSSLTQINCGLGQAAGYFDLGVITFTSGANVGITRSIRRYSPGVITLALPLVSACAVGDTFNARAGCDGLKATCSGKFNNLPNFRGFPFIPVPESVI